MINVFDFSRIQRDTCSEPQHLNGQALEAHTAPTHTSAQAMGCSQQTFTDQTVSQFWSAMSLHCMLMGNRLMYQPPICKSCIRTSQ